MDMSSTLLGTSSRDGDGRNSIVCRTWRQMMAVGTLALLAIGSAFASPGTFVAGGNLTQPRGAIRTANGLGGTDVWVADNTLGFCRIDNGSINAATCLAQTSGQLEDDRSVAAAAGGGFIYLTDTATAGVRRVTMGISPVDSRSVIATTDQLGGATNFGIAKFSPEAIALGPDGKLYVGVAKGGQVLRITAPAATLGSQRLELVGQQPQNTSNSFAFLGNDLFMVAFGIESRVANAPSCNGACSGQVVFGRLFARMAVVGDGTRYLWWGAGRAAVRFDGTTTSINEIYSQSAFFPGVAIPEAYNYIFGMSYDRATGEIFVADDFFSELLALPPNQGRLFSVKPPVTTEGQLTSPFGPIGPLTPAVVDKSATVGVLYATGVTQPHGLLFLGTHFWLSDGALGFCRLDVNPATQLASINRATCFQPTASFRPGNASFDTPAVSGTATINVYVPDRSATSAGIFRLVFNPNTETLSAPLAIAPGTNSPAAVAIGPEGSLYLGLLNSSTIQKITTPATVPSAPAKIATAGSGVNGMAFQGNDLYLSQVNGDETIIARASPSLGRGSAVLVGTSGSLGHGATPPFNVVGALSVASGGKYIYGGGTSNVLRWDTFLQTSLLWTSDGAIGPLNALTTNLQNISALGVSTSGMLAIGDDPSVDPNTGLTATPGQGRIFVVLPQ
jgi:hypothetical protein